MKSDGRDYGIAIVMNTSDSPDRKGIAGGVDGWGFNASRYNTCFFILLISFHVQTIQILYGSFG